MNFYALPHIFLYITNTVGLGIDRDPVPIKMNEDVTQSRSLSGTKKAPGNQLLISCPLAEVLGWKQVRSSQK